MTIEDGHFRTDGEKIEPCCEECANDLTFGFNEYDNKLVLRVKCYTDEGLESETDICYVRYCPCCGAKLEYVDKLDSGQ